jgi:hypothetical protein
MSSPSYEYFAQEGGLTALWQQIFKDQGFLAALLLKSAYARLTGHAGQHGAPGHAKCIDP